MIKGKTIIELTDVNTGETERTEDENMITNVISDFFSHNIEGGLYNIASSTSAFSGRMFPLCPNAFGGILLFSDKLDEDKDKYYAPSANPCVGYASNDINSTSNVMRGSLNLTESGKTSKGYKFVWDFATSQANGTISAVALTHKYGGIGYMGDLYDNTNKIWYLKTIEYSTNELAIKRLYIKIVEVNFKENYYVSIMINLAHEIIIQKGRKAYTSVGLNDDLIDAEPTIIEEHKIKPTSFVLSSKGYSNGAYDFVDGENGYWYGFWHAANSSGNASIQWIKINKTDYSFTEGTWAIENCQITDVGMSSGYNDSPQRYIKCTILNGYVYFMAYNCKAVYRINLENGADIVKIPLGFTSKFSCQSDYAAYGDIYIYRLGDWVCGSDFRISSDDKVYKCDNQMPLKYCGTQLFQYGPFFMSYGVYYGDRVKRELFLRTPYLATINNLQSSVIKTADKTTKITYLIEEK